VGTVLVVDARVVVETIGRAVASLGGFQVNRIQRLD
jgi:hypothetical protein